MFLLIKNWFSVAPIAWWSLLIGWLWVLVSYIMAWDVEASGAILVGTCVLAEMRFNLLKWRSFGFMAGMDDLTWSLPAQQDRQSKNIPRGQAAWYNSSVGEASTQNAKGEDYYLKSVQALHRLANDAEDHPGSHPPTWFYYLTKERVERRINIIISISAILGTILWGYGDFFFSNCTQ